MSIYKSKFNTASREAMRAVKSFAADLKVPEAEGGLPPDVATALARKVLAAFHKSNANDNALELIDFNDEDVAYLESLLPEGDPLRSDSPTAKSLAAMDKALDQAGRFAKSMIHVGTAAAARL